MLNLKNQKKADWLEWLCVLSMFFSQYIEFIFVVIAVFFIRKRLYINKKVLIACSLIALYSICVIYFLNYNIVHFAIRGFAPLFLSFLYISLYFQWKNRIPQLWDKYCSVCFIMSILGLFQVIISIIAHINIFFMFNNYDISVSGIYQQPTATLLEMGDFAAVLTPCIAYNIIKVPHFRDIGFKIWFMLFVATLSFSNLAILGVILSLCIRFYIKYKVLVITSIAGAAVIIAVFNPFSNLLSTEYDANDRGFSSVMAKFIQSFEALEYIDDVDEIAKYNLSSFATYSNLYVGLNAPLRLTGTGLGTHEDNYYFVYPRENVGTMERAFGLNKEDAYSLFTRLLSEMGILGIAFYLLFVFRNLSLKDPLSASLFVLIVMHLVGNGNYFINGFLFFNVMFYYRHQIADK